MKNLFTFVLVKCPTEQSVLTSGKNIYRPFEEVAGHHDFERSSAFTAILYCPEPYRGSLDFLNIHRLDQANSVLDVSKPRGQEFVFHGVFFFCFLFLQCNTFFFLYFLFGKPLNL